MIARTSDINMLSPKYLLEFPGLLRLEMVPSLFEIDNLLAESFSSEDRSSVLPGHQSC